MRCISRWRFQAAAGNAAPIAHSAFSPAYCHWRQWGWIGFRVVNGFRLGGLDGSQATDYLGSNFAVHSALLLGLAWLLPVFLQRKVKPSRERAAARGLRTGMQQALDQVEQAVRNNVAVAARERQLFDKRVGNDIERVDRR